MTACGLELLAKVRDAGGSLALPKTTPGGATSNSASITTVKGLAGRGYLRWDRLEHGRLRMVISPLGRLALDEAEKGRAA